MGEDWRIMALQRRMDHFRYLDVLEFCHENPESANKGFRFESNQAAIPSNSHPVSELEVIIFFCYHCLLTSKKAYWSYQTSLPVGQGLGEPFFPKLVGLCWLPI